jgi:hypothetical protein
MSSANKHKNAKRVFAWDPDQPQLGPGNQSKRIQQALNASASLPTLIENQSR